MYNARLYTGTIMLIAAVAMRLVWRGDWSLVLLIVLGVFLVLASFEVKGQRHG